MLNGCIAQLVEQRPFKPRVPGSSPGGPSNEKSLACLGLFHWLIYERSTLRTRSVSGENCQWQFARELSDESCAFNREIRGRGTWPSPFI